MTLQQLISEVRYGACVRAPFFFVSEHEQLAMWLRLLGLAKQFGQLIDDLRDQKRDGTGLVIMETKPLTSGVIAFVQVAFVLTDHSLTKASAVICLPDPGHEECARAIMEKLEKLTNG